MKFKDIQASQEEKERKRRQRDFTAKHLGMNKGGKHKKKDKYSRKSKHKKVDY